MGELTRGTTYATHVVGAACLVQGLLDRLGVVEAIDQALGQQPAVDTTYGTLAQVLIVNRMTFEPQPLYRLGPWAEQHGIDRLFGIEAAWLTDDRLGQLVERLAAHQVTIWTAVLRQALQHYPVALDWLREDTTSVYFEGTYTDATGRPREPIEGAGPRRPRVVRGYNKDGKPKKVQFVLSLLTAGASGRVPIWYRPWDGNQTDEPVYVADLQALRATGLAPANAVVMGDRKLCTHETLLTWCRAQQQFLAPHPWTDTAKAVWQETWAALVAGHLAWTDVAYVSRNHARRPPAARPQHRVCEVGQQLVDPATGEIFPLRWLFTWSSTKAAQDATRRATLLAAGEQALTRVARLLGKYDYRRRATIEARIEQALQRTHAHPYLAYTLEGSDADPAWRLTWTVDADAVAAAARLDGVVLLCSNVPPERCAAAELVVKHKGQIGVEQTIDFLKSPVQLRPMWLHSPTRLAGLTLLIMLAVLVAALLEHQVRQWSARTGDLVRGLLPEGRDTPYPTAKTLLRTFHDYALVLCRFPDGHTEVAYPALRPAQHHIWSIMELAPLPTQPLRWGCGK